MRSEARTKRERKRIWDALVPTPLEPSIRGGTQGLTDMDPRSQHLFRSFEALEDIALRIRTTTMYNYFVL